MKKYRKWGREAPFIKLKPNWREEMIKAFTKHGMSYKKRVQDLDKALERGEAVIG